MYDCEVSHDRKVSDNWLVSDTRCNLNSASESLHTPPLACQWTSGTMHSRHNRLTARVERGSNWFARTAAMHTGIAKGTHIWGSDCASEGSIEVDPPLGAVAQRRTRVAPALRQETAKGYASGGQNVIIIMLLVH